MFIYRRREGGTFEWVLGQFKKGMNNKSRISIFTDQDFAMSKAIEKVTNIWHYVKLYLILCYIIFRVIYNIIFGDI